MDWQTAEECVAEAHGQAEQERGRFFGRAAGVKFRLRTVVSARRHSATRQQARNLVGIHQQRVSLT